MKYNKEKGQIEMSVRELCAAALSGGDIDNRVGVDFKKMREGARIHRQLQSERGGEYHSEVQMQNLCRYNGISYFVNGRADGVDVNGDDYIVEEIKTVSSFERFLIPGALHMAQLRCYGYFLACKTGTGKLTLRLTYYNTVNNEEKHTDLLMTADELRLFYIDLITKIEHRAKFIYGRAENILPSVADAVFPYPELRRNQADMIRECFTDLTQGDRLFIEAPTGIGKTISTLYPAAKALGCGGCDRIFYLTAKASTRREAFFACEKLFSGGVHLRSIVLSARDQMCINDAAHGCPGGVSKYCNPDMCRYAKGYYDRSESAVFSLLSKQFGYSRDTILKTARQYSVCPYELSLDLSMLCDIIICDYNYVFSPLVYLRRYFDEENGECGKYIFLVDEAHNLVDRARDMYSAKLKLSEFINFGVDYEREPGGSTLFEYVAKVAGAIGNQRAMCDDMNTDTDGNETGFHMSHDEIGGFPELLSEFCRKLMAWERKNQFHPLYYEADRLMTAAREYLVISEYADNSFLYYVSVSGGETESGIFCLNPSGVMKKLLDRAYSSVLFSATLTPGDYFVDLLGGGEKAVSVSYPSPFPEENLCIAGVDFISTRYGDRDKNPAGVASCIAAVVSAKKGNYIVYFPSYKYMENVYSQFVKRYPKVKTIIQKRGMTLNEKEEFIGFFRADTGKLRIGFCVLGGSFSEGVDLPGSRLIGTIIVGTGLPGLSNERNIIRDYFNENNGCGYDYAYTYPGLVNVMQAAGRVIRTENDCGIIVLIDDRYMSDKYIKMLPERWREMKIAGNSSSLAEIARLFWDKDVK